MGDDKEEQDDEFVSRIGPMNIDWPRTVGYYGAIAAAVGFEIIAPPLALFIAAVPLFKLMKRRNATRGERFVAAVVEGAGKPVGGDGDGVVRPAWIDDQERDEK
jgi:hypothetical protein